MVSMLRKLNRPVRWAAITAVAMWAGAAQAAPKTHSPPTSTALSSLLNTKSGPAGALELGDTIVLQANTTYTGTFILPKVDVGSGWITIQSSAIASLPGDGVRVNLSHASNMPKIRPANGSQAPAIKTATSAHHFKLIGVEIIAPSDNSRIYSLVELGSGGWTAGGESPQSTVAEVPQYLIIDRCIIRAHSDTQDVRRGISLNSGNTDIINSHISNIKENGAQSAGIGGWNGTGNYNVVNNYIEAAGINFIIGGATALIPGIPENISFRRNHCYKKNQWRWGHPEYLGINFAVVTHFEIKFGRYFDVQGNIFENTWAHVQDQSVIFKVDSQTTSASDPAYAAKMKSEDIVFTKNIIRSAPDAIVLQGRDWNPAPGQPPQLRRVQIRDNLAYDISRANYGVSQWGTTGGRFVRQGNGGEQITIENNTCFHDRNTLTLDSPEYPMVDFIFRNNISRAFGNFTGGDSWQNSHINGPFGSDQGTGSLTQVAPGAIFAKNVIAGMNSAMISTYSTAHQSANWLSIPATFSGVLVNYNNGVGSAPFAGWKVVGWDQPTNASLYPYNNTGTNGKDIGCDIDQLLTATEGCVSGVWSSNPPPSGGGDIVVYASEAHKLVGTWAVTSDSTAAGGSRIGQANGGVPKINSPAASPGNYFEVAFQAQANTPYHIWVRGKALNNDWANDSAYAQFDNSVDSGGAAIWRIGTTGGTTLFLEEGSGAGLNNWGWNDNDYNATPGVLGQNVIFNKSGTQIMRVQQREDGYQIDQIVLSPSNYLTTRPGATLNDNTILTEAGSNPVNIVLHAKNAPTKVGTWANTTDSTAASGARIGQPNAGVPKINTPASSPANYFEMSFFAYANTPYHIWFRGKALSNDWQNDSAYAQFNNSVNSSNVAQWRIGTTSGTTMFLEEGSGAGLADWGWNDNDYNASSGVFGENVIFNTTGMQTIRVQQREDGYQIDQIVLSPSTYLSTRPGTTLNDTTILPEQQ